MANKKVSQLVSKPSVLVTDLFPIADPTTGQLFKTTISDLGTAIGSGVSSVNTLVGAVVLDTDDIQELASPTNRWFTDTRARAALSASSPLAYNSGTGVFSIAQANGSTNGFLSSADWTTFNAKQTALNGTGFVKISGTTISYDNSTYALDSAVVKLTGTQSISGVKTFNSQPVFANTVMLQNTASGTVLFGGYTTLWTTDSALTVLVGTASSTTIGFSLLYDSSAQRSYTMPTSNGTLALTSQLSAYLPLGGGTMTGALFGASASFSGFVGFGGNTSPLAAVDVTGAGIFSSSVRSSGYYLTGMTSGSGALYYSSGTNRVTIANYNASGILTFEVNGGNTALVLNADFSATFAGAISLGTNTLSSGRITISTNDQSTNRLTLTNSGSGGRSYSIVGGLPGANNSSFAIHDETANSTRFNISSTGAATFTGALSGTSALFSGTFEAGRTGGAVTAGDLSVDTTSTSAKVIIGRLSATGSDNTTLIGRNRVGVQGWSIDSFGAASFGSTLAVTGAATFSSTINTGTLSLGGGTMQSSGDFYIGTNNANFIQFYTSNQNRMIITSSGNVGIGVTSTGDKLEVFSGASRAVQKFSTSTNGMYTTYASNAGAAGYIGNGQGILSSAIESDFAIRSEVALLFAAGGNAERMRITSTGYLKASNNGTYSYLVNSSHEFQSNVSDAHTVGIVNSSASPYGQQMIFTGASPNNTTNFYIFASDSTTSRFIVYSNGSVVNRTGSYGTISDVKFKENIVDATPKLGDLTKLKVRNFNLKGESTKQIGFIAQEFEKVFPNMVDVSTELGTDGETYKSIKTSILVPMLVKAIQELNDKITTLENK